MWTTLSSKAYPHSTQEKSSVRNTMGNPSELTIKVVGNINDIPADDWDACANPSNLPRNPFGSHAFLSALEDSGSATARTGWAPHHVILSDTLDQVLGVAPLYLKNHSQGEYVFDHGWASAFERAGGQYYPKLQCSIPFSPVTGRRLFVKPDSGQHQYRDYLLAGMIQVADKIGVSSLHLTFLTEEEWTALGQAGFLQRIDQQFHWINHDYGSFDDFLADLSSRKRKQIRKERREALASGVEIECLTGKALREEHWDAFFQFYMDTGSRKWGTPYLTREFFSLMSERMADDILLILCKRNGRYIAGALNIIGSDVLFGRNWGCIEDHKYLHFEACYYQAIEFAINRKLKKVEAGAQGAHKLQRGYMPMPTYSSHWIANPGFREAISHYLESERAHVQDDINYLEDRGPFRQSNEEKP